MKSFKHLLMQIIAVIVAVYHGFQGSVLAANTYDAAVQTHAETVNRTNDAAITARHLLWKAGASANSVALCTASDIPIGTIDNTETETGMNQTVLLLGHGSTRKMVASKAIAYGVVIYSAAAGKVSDSGTYPVGIALTAAGADGDIIEVQCYMSPTGAGVPTTLYDAHTILYATTDNTPAALTVGASTIVGRKASGNIVALTGAEAKAIQEPITWTAAASSGTGANLAIPITHRSVNRTVAGTEALTLADGAYLGQKLSIICVAQSGGTGTLTPTTASGWTSIAFAEKGQGCELEWTTAGWRLLGFHYVTNKPLIAVP